MCMCSHIWPFEWIMRHSWEMFIAIAFINSNPNRFHLNVQNQNERSLLHLYFLLHCWIDRKRAFSAFELSPWLRLMFKQSILKLDGFLFFVHLKPLRVPTLYFRYIPESSSSTMYKLCNVRHEFLMQNIISFSFPSAFSCILCQPTNVERASSSFELHLTLIRKFNGVYICHPQL